MVLAMGQPVLSLIIPLYNEEKRIKNVLERYVKFLDKEFDNYEVIGVCNGCTDSTPSIVREFGRRNSRVKCLQFKDKLGKGGAILEGFKLAKGEYIGFIDADDSVAPTEFKKLISALTNADGAIASRRIKGSIIQIRQSLVRRISSKIFNILVRLIFRLNFMDTQCGAKVFKKEAVLSILPTMVLKGFEFDVELLWRMVNKGYRIKEIPIVWKQSPGSRFSLKYAPSMFFNLLKLRLGAW